MHLIRSKRPKDQFTRNQPGVGASGRTSEMNGAGDVEGASEHTLLPITMQERTGSSSCFRPSQTQILMCMTCATLGVTANPSVTEIKSCEKVHSQSHIVCVLDEQKTKLAICTLRSEDVVKSMVTPRAGAQPFVHQSIGSTMLADVLEDPTVAGKLFGPPRALAHSPTCYCCRSYYNAQSQRLS